MFFLGEYVHAIDEKSRLTVPVKFREALQEGGVITRGYDRNLILYTNSDFEGIAARAKAFSPTVADHRALLRMIFSSASEVELDRTGRILIPPFLREYAGLEDEAVIAGAGLYIEIWNKAGWEEQLRTMNDPAANAVRFSALDLGSA